MHHKPSNISFLNAPLISLCIDWHAAVGDAQPYYIFVRLCQSAAQGLANTSKTEVLQCPIPKPNVVPLQCVLNCKHGLLGLCLHHS